MPLIDVTVRPGYAFPPSEIRQFDAKATRHFIRTVFGPWLPELFVQNEAMFGMTAGTPVDAVQVTFHDFSEDDINVPDVWIKVQFSEEQPDQSKRLSIRSSVFDAIAAEFKELDAVLPANFVVDLFWGPTHGCGTANGVAFEW